MMINDEHRLRQFFRTFAERFLMMRCQAYGF